jgi:hypothetical protein
VDPVARRSAGHALEEAQRVGGGLVEMHGMISGVETRVTERIAILADALGINDIRKRFRKADDERSRQQARALTIDGQTTASSYVAGVWTDGITVNPTNLDSNTGLQRPRTGSRMCIGS